MTTRLTLLAILIALFYSCNKNELHNHLILSGTIENPASDTLTILNRSHDVIKYIILDKNNSFKDTLTEVPEGYYTLETGKERAELYLKPTYDLRLTTDVKEFHASIKYSGKGAIENNYLAQKRLLQDNFENPNKFFDRFKLPEKEFVKFGDSLYSLEKNFLEKTKNLDKDFSYWESKSLEFKKLEVYGFYESFHGIFTNNDNFKVSENFPDIYKNVDLSDEKLLIFPSYLSYIKIFLEKESEKINRSTLQLVKTIKEEVKNNLIKEELFYDIGKYDLKYAKDLDSVFNQIKPFLVHEKYLSTVVEIYNTTKKWRKTEFETLQKGHISPTFTFNDIDGKSISLADLKGKLVYIDIWATWCSPCRKEIPYLKEMEAYFKGKDIEFVSICKSDTEERWRKMVADKKLSGIQLFAPDKNASFFKEYKVRHIPRFILIDKNGKIIDADARKPSNSDLQKEIENYL